MARESMALSSASSSISQLATPKSQDSQSLSTNMINTSYSVKLSLSDIIVSLLVKMSNKLDNGSSSGSVGDRDRLFTRDVSVP